MATDSHRNEETYLLIGITSALGVALTVTCTVFIITLVFFSKKEGSSKGINAQLSARNPMSAQQEPIYDELYRDPLHYVGTSSHVASNTSPPHDMQPCEAYVALPNTSF